MENINRIELAGTIGSARISTVGENQIIHLSVATNYIYRSQSGDCVIDTTWHSVSFWGGRGQDLSGFTKGAKAHIIGRLKQSRYTTSDGEARYTVEILAQTLELINE